MTKRDGNRRASKRLASHLPSASTTSTPDHPRRSKGRARTRASGVKIIDDPMEDEKRLKDQLTRMGFYAVNTLGDGNCLFRALSDQLYGTPNRHLEIRQEVCGYLAKHETRYKAFVDMDEEESWESHLQLMAKQGTYGGHLELSAFANYHRRTIKIIQPGMVYVISYEDHSSSSSSAGKLKGKQQQGIKGKGKRSDDSIPDISSSSSSETPVYLVYHQWEHYSSVRNLDGPHSGIPCIRERDMEGSACINQSQEKCNKDSTSSKSRMMSYRECSSSPISAGSSSTATTTTTTTGASSEGIGTGSPVQDPVQTQEDKNASKEKDKDLRARSNSSSSNQLKPDRPRRNNKVTKIGLKPNSPMSRPDSSLSTSTLDNSYRDDHFSHLDDRLDKDKPLSKRALRLARRNLILSSNNNNGKGNESMEPTKIDSVGLLRELKV
ncbi:hypothetical protein MJO28_009303 [Puccinia striiformis f. sp. tritici]|uniref:OTU domain-containing protein n=2 Tax=Puccinia striiformis TaxID=27350 RepID=A0A2S4WP33_9BASI|nr:hypothetical protein MJO28_009303 [Puccinia striiformis f. sp. tritici]POW23525.1 hypothetical protein PSHT_00130 [Puccinia striiformis]